MSDRVWIFGNRTHPSGYRYRWYECEPIHQILLASWSFRRKGWHPRARRLARLRALYWTLIRWHETEICGRCGGPVGVVYDAPDKVWEHHSGFTHAARFPGGQAGAGILCIRCLSDLYRESAGDFLCWTCRPYREEGEEPLRDDSAAASAEIDRT